ncbi:MAG: hypothetical protein Q9179_005988 [Wetmoreana sp. 5 TL-2023]
MSTAEPLHLTQVELSVKDKQILAELVEWLSDADFDARTNKYIDKGLVDKWALLREMDFIQQFGSPIYQVRRVLHIYPRQRRLTRGDPPDPRKYTH